MQFETRNGEVIDFNPFDQASIDAAKAKAPGEGIGLAVGEALVNAIRDGEITESSQLPEEYQHLGSLLELKGASEEEIEAVLGNANQSIIMNVNRERKR